MASTIKAYLAGIITVVIIGYCVFTQMQISSLEKGQMAIVDYIKTKMNGDDQYSKMQSFMHRSPPARPTKNK